MREEAEIQRELPEVLFSSLQRQPESIIEQGCVFVRESYVEVLLWTRSYLLLRS